MTKGEKRIIKETLSRLWRLRRGAGKHGHKKLYDSVMHEITGITCLMSSLGYNVDNF